MIGVLLSDTIITASLILLITSLLYHARFVTVCLTCLTLLCRICLVKFGTSQLLQRHTKWCRYQSSSWPSQKKQSSSRRQPLNARKCHIGSRSRKLRLWSCSTKWPWLKTRWCKVTIMPAFSAQTILNLKMHQTRRRAQQTRKARSGKKNGLESSRRRRRDWQARRSGTTI